MIMPKFVGSRARNWAVASDMLAETSREIKVDLFHQKEEKSQGGPRHQNQD